MDMIKKAVEAIQEGGGKNLYRKIRDYIDYHYKPAKNEWKTIDVVKSDMRQFAYWFGYRFDIYNPRTFTEKVHTYKLLYRDASMSEIVDKYTFKTFISKKLNSDQYVIPAYGVWDSIDAIESTWADLPSEFVLKSTISSDGNNIIFVSNKDKVSFDSIREDLKKCFLPKNTQLNGYSQAYYSLRPRVLAEQYVHELSGNDNLKDYKFYCFNGRVEFVYTTSRVFENKENPSEADYPRTFFDLDWNKIPVSLGNHPTSNYEEKPVHFQEMIEISKILSEGFPFVRIDFYDTIFSPLLGEMTFYPTGGTKPLKPDSFDKKMGDLFIIPPEKLIRI